MAAFEDVEDAGRAVSEIMHSGILPSALEIVDQQTIHAINQNTDLNLPPVEAILIAETEGCTQEEVLYQLNKVVDTFNHNNAAIVKRAESIEEAEALWAARKSAGGAIARINTNRYVEDLAVPISKVTEMLKAIARIARDYSLKIPTMGHAGDGNLHPAISFDATDPEEVERVEKAAGALLTKVIELGGTVSGEHGIGVAKVPFLAMERDEVYMEVMRSLKSLFDPNNILNPGKMGL
jgi:glycolate oxidase